MDAFDVDEEELYLVPSSKRRGVAGRGTSEYTRGNQIWQGQLAHSKLETLGFVVVALGRRRRKRGRRRARSSDGSSSSGCVANKMNTCYHKAGRLAL